MSVIEKESGRPDQKIMEAPPPAWARHTPYHYRCFLPDLAGFAVHRCGKTNGETIEVQHYREVAKLCKDIVHQPLGSYKTTTHFPYFCIIIFMLPFFTEVVCMDVFNLIRMLLQCPIYSIYPS